ncbi:MAG: energy transducer TonB [Flavobacteriaceae bacterium]
MKNLFFILFMSFSAVGFSQEWGGVDKNKVTMKEVAPTWPGCESSPGTTDACFRQMLTKHIGQNWMYPAEAWKNNEQGKVIVEFMITESGTVDIKNVTGGTPLLQEEAKRNIMLIPKMAKPGMLAGKPKAIKYTVPFNFKTGK